MQFLHLLICDFGSIFNTRERGQRAAFAIGLHAEAPNSFLLDFQSVDAVGPPALDEILTAVDTHLRRHRDSNVTALATNLSESNREILEFVLGRGAWPGFAHRTASDVELIGARPHLSQTLKAAQELGPFTAPQLADHLDLKLPNTNQRLKLLLQAGALGRVPDETAENGTRFAYFPLRSPDLDSANFDLVDTSAVRDADDLADALTIRLEPSDPTPDLAGSRWNLLRRSS